MTRYEELKQKRQAEFDSLPIFFAFTNESLKEQLAERNATTKDICSIGRGGFCLKSDIEKIKEFAKKKSEIDELMETDSSFRVEAFIYEMCNHEYAINYYQGNWDVLNVFAEKELIYDDSDDYRDYLKQMNRTEWIDDYTIARREYYKLCEENEWF